MALRRGNSGSIRAHCSSVRSVVYDFLGEGCVFILLSIFFLLVSGHPLSEKRRITTREIVLGIRANRCMSDSERSEQ